MSNPVNVLDQFRTFSYHHFIVAANNTEALRQLQTGDLSFAKLSSLKHGESVSASGGSKVVMVTNSEVDSKFYVDTISYSTKYLTVSDVGRQMTMATSMELVIRETGGATFLNFLQSLMDDVLQASLQGCVFLLKTFFVGHKPDGSVSTIQVQPFPFNIGHMDSSFDHTGGIHQIRAIVMSVGAPLQDHSMLYVNRNLSLATSDNSILLKDMIKDLEKKLNDQLKLQYNAVKQATGGLGRLTKYKITIPKDWDAYTIKCTSKDNYVEALFPKEEQATQQTSTSAQSSSSSATPESDRFKSSVNTAVKVTVIQILSEIFKHCDQIHQNFVDNLQKSQNVKKPSNVSDLPKLYQTVTSVTSDENLVTIHFDVVNYYLPTLPDQNSKPVVQNNTKGLTEQQKTNAQIAGVNADEWKYGMVFDFIFTGKNTDIMQMDIKANSTNVLIQANRTSVNGATGAEAVQNASANPSQTQNTNKDTIAVVPIRKNDPVYLPELSAEAQHGYVYASQDSAKLREQFKNYLAFLVAITTAKSHMTIRGNPVFLNQQIMPIMPHDDSAYQTALDTRHDESEKRAKQLIGNYDQATSTSYIGEVPSQIPLFAKVNMFTPELNPTSNKIEYVPFWYQGYYRIMSIDNKFANGEFTQDLQLKPWNLDELTQSINAPTTTTTTTK